MATTPERNYALGTARTTAVGIDVGLRQYMLRVYNYMAGGLALTGVIAYVIANVPSLTAAVVGTPIYWVAAIGSIGIAFFFSFRIHKMSVGTAQTLFWAYAGLLGLFLAPIFLIYTQASIARVFFITAGTFGAVSLYGYTTKRDLTRFGSFLMMGLFGLVLAVIVNWFIGSSALDFAISVIGVLVFTGLAAWDTQRIKESYFEGDAPEAVTKNAIFGAFMLYLDFVNLFLMLLRLFGATRE